MFTVYKWLTFIKLLFVKVSELDPDVQDMQSGAKCRSQSSLDIHVGSDRFQNHVLGQVFYHRSPSFLDARAARRGPGEAARTALGRRGARGGRDWGRDTLDTIQSPKRLYKAPTDNTKPRQII